MAVSGSDRVAAHRERQRRRAEVTAAARSFVPGEGERQERAIAHALAHLEGWEDGEHANPYPPALASAASGER